MRHLGDAEARGAAPSLETLGLDYNKIGDEGATWPMPSCGARARAQEGSTSAINPASDAAQQAVEDALKHRK